MTKEQEEAIEYAKTHSNCCDASIIDHGNNFYVCSTCGEHCSDQTEDIEVKSGHTPVEVLILHEITEINKRQDTLLDKLMDISEQIKEIKNGK